MDYSSLLAKNGGLGVEWCAKKWNRTIAFLSVITLRLLPRATLYLHDYILALWSIKVI
jgi:hypothetical protein